MVEERRKHNRTPQEELVKVDVVSDEKPSESMVFECNSRDFSEKGIRLHGHQKLDLHSHVNLVVHMSEHKQDYSLAGTIKWVTETTEHEILAGIELSDGQTTDLAKWQSLFN